jgi:soluble P-type ATPase
MIALDIPGFGALRLEHLAVDFNGTLAIDGKLLPGVS